MKKKKKKLVEGQPKLASSTYCYYSDTLTVGLESTRVVDLNESLTHCCAFSPIKDASEHDPRV